MLNAMELALVGAAAVSAGFVNALAGGGSLITFPALVALGVPAVAANITNTIALCPGYLGATWGQAADLAGQKHRLRILIPASLLGGLLGAILLLGTGEAVFRRLIPYLILFAAGLLAIQDPLRKRLFKDAPIKAGGARAEFWSAALVALAAVYGGYFGAGVSVIVLAVLAVLLHDTLTRLNALKQAIALATNFSAAVFPLFSGQAVWPAVAVMAIGAVLGGFLGGRCAGRVQPALLRGIVVAIGIVVGAVYLLRG